MHRRGQPKEQDSLNAAAHLIDDESIRAYLMIPRTGPAEPGEVAVDDPYRIYWTRLKEIVGDILPRLRDQSRWSEYRYHPRQKEEIRYEGTPQEEDPLWLTARGKILFKYDPDHEGKKKTLLILETDMQMTGTWEWN